MTLPTAYPGHPHATEEARRIADNGMILLAEVGSGVHGTAVSGTDDVDHMGVCVEPPEYVTGLRTFEQFERHTAWDRPGGLRERSGAGDLDVVVYGARKFCRLALDGNPSVLTLLFAPTSSMVATSGIGAGLMAHPDWFVSMRACDRYLGYLRSQRAGLCGVGRVNRPELIERYGFDVKYAGHAVRLGVQGLELMRGGWIELPMAEPWRNYIRSIRNGDVPYAEVLEVVGDLERQLQEIRDSSWAWKPPEEPARAKVDRWLHRAYSESWKNLVLRGTLTGFRM